MLLLIEFGLTVAIVAIALAFPHKGFRLLEPVERAFGHLARRRGLAVLVVGLTSLALRAALLPILPIPQPQVQDEFSYLLAADTFAHGRLTNPTHPMWVHFETLFVLQQPTYASKYPAAQSVFLAAGQVIAGHPFWGMWFSVGLMCAVLTWMMQAWLPEGWALLGGFLAVIRLGTFSYWANSYWGGAVAAIGGALILGALPRLKSSPRVRDALLLGLGVVVLANSRPYEGLVFTLPVGVALFAWLLGKNKTAWPLIWRRVLMPLAVLVILAGGVMGYYFWRVTGSAFRMPYQAYDDAYDPNPYLVWQHPKPLPVYRHKSLHDYFAYWKLRTASARSPGSLSSYALGKLIRMYFFFLGSLLLLPFLLLAAAAPSNFSWRQFNPGTRFLLIATAISFIGLALEGPFYEAHYAAPMACMIIALVLLAMQCIRPWQARGRPAGLAITRAIPLVAVLLLALRTAAVPLHIPLPKSFPETWCSPAWPDPDRARIISQLHQEGGRHLVMVRYSPSHGAFNPEWVYNAADIDASDIVWARDMDPEQNAELFRYFSGRRVWLLEPDQKSPQLLPYPSAQTASR
jgi:hypothetical protein